MARVLIPEEYRRIDEPGEVAAFLAPHGIFQERWELEERVDPEAEPDAVLAAYAPEIERLKAQGGYVTADVISVTPQTPNLQALMAKYAKEHTHAEDEVRFILKGRGLFHIRPRTGPVFAIQVEAGDLINVPRGTRHWFHLCEEHTIRAIRLFLDPSGWVPDYQADATHERYVPMCWGPTHIRAEPVFAG